MMVLPIARPTLPATRSAPDGVGLVERVPVSAMRLARLPAGAAALRRHVAEVVRCGSKKKMIGSDTLRIVALVADVKPACDRPVMQLPREAVRGQRLGGVAARIQLPVAHAVQGCRPFPTAIRLAHLRPKPLRDRRGLAWLRSLCAVRLRPLATSRLRRFSLVARPDSRLNAIPALGHPIRLAAPGDEIEGVFGQIASALRTPFQHALNLTLSGAGA